MEIRPRLTEEEYEVVKQWRERYNLPENHILKGVSTLVDSNGNVRLQWQKTSLHHDELLEQVREATKALAKSVKPAKPVARKCKATDKDVIEVYPMGDPHIGMYSWAAETGQDFDCEIAERNLISATTKLVAGARSSETALIVNLGDFFHSDTLENTTRRSGHALDVDTRWPRVIQVGVNAMRGCIDAALRKHKQVHVYNVIGNHDDQSSVMLSMILQAYYRKENRVTVDDGVGYFSKFRFGKTLLGFHHGHGTKMDNLGGIMASEWPEDWGASRHRYWLTGHIHHQQMRDLPGCKVESFRTMAARDAWAASKGYLSPRDMHRITYHKEYGEVGREIVTVEMVSDV